MKTEAVVVVGVCAPERHRYAVGVGRLRNVPVLYEPGGPRHSGGSRRTWASTDAVVVEAATDVDLAHLLGDETPSPAVVCVVDARHMVDDFCDGAALLDDAESGDDRGDTGARGRQAAALIEAADTVVFVNWESVDTSRLSVLMALASHLSPSARVRLARSLEDDLRAAAGTPAMEAVWQERAGWVRTLNAEHDPYMNDRRVTTFRYEQLRPFHPERLVRALDEELEPGQMGLILRSAGFCRLATRAAVLARWEQVGSAMWIDPLTADAELQSTNQDIAFTGLDLHVSEIRRVLDDAVLTDAELLAGPAAWSRITDPLPRWPIDVGDPERRER